MSNAAGDVMKGFLIGSAGYQGVGHREAIAAVREAGFGGVEILSKPGHFEPENSAHVEEVCSALADWPEAVVTFHAPFHTADLGCADRQAWEQDIQLAAEALRAASTFRAESATIHVRGRGEGLNWGDENLTAFQAALRILVPIAAQCNMTLSLENLPPGRFTERVEDLLGLVEPHPSDRVGVCFDTGHAHLVGDIVGMASKLASRAHVMHIHDNHSQGKDEHKVPGEGTIPWPQLVEALQANGYRGRNVMEVVRREPAGDTIDTVRRTLDDMAKAILNTGLYSLNGSNRT